MVEALWAPTQIPFQAENLILAIFTVSHILDRPLKAQAAKGHFKGLPHFQAKPRPPDETRESRV